MPSGARKRKAAKKKMKDGETHNNNNNSSSNSSSTHSQGSEDRRSFDDRESESGEIEREEEARVVDYEEGSGTNGKKLSEKIAENTKEERYEKNGSRVVDVAAETPIVILSSEDKEIAVEEVKPVDFVEELKVVDVNSVVDTKPEYEIPKQNAIAVESASAELVRDVVSLPQEINVGFGSSVTSDLALPISDEKEKFSSISEGLKSEKVESKVLSKEEEKSSVAPPVDPSPKSGLDSVKTVETSNAPVVSTTQVVECVKNKETTTSEVDNIKEISTQKRSMDQTSIGSNPLPVQRTSMMGCCGLFELFSGANR